MSGQTSFAVVHPTDAASSGQEEEVPPPPSESIKVQYKSECADAKFDVSRESVTPSSPSKKLGKPSGEKLVDKAKEYSNGSSPAPKQPSSLRHEVSAHDRHGANAADNTRSPHPQPAKGNAVNKHDQDVTKVSQPKATSKYGLSGSADATEISTKTAADARVQAGETAPISGQSNTDGLSINTPSTPSSPSKKKKNKKKKKKRKSPLSDDSPSAETEPSEAPDQIQKGNSIPQVAAKVENPELETAPVNVKKGLVPSDSAVVAPASVPTPTMVTPSKITKAAEASAPKETHFVHHDEMNEKNSGNKNNRHVEKTPEKIITDAMSRASVNEVKKTETRDIMESGPSTELSSPNKTDISAQDNQSSDPDDGMWETVEVKPRGRRRKGGSKKSSLGAQHNGNTSNNITSNNSNGRNHSNNENVSAHHDGGSSHNGRRRHNKRNREKNRNNSEQQHNKMIKDVILHILDAVDDEIVRMGVDSAKQLGITVPVGDNEQNNPHGKHGKLSSSASNNKQNPHQQHSNDEQRRKQSNGVAASSKALPTPSMASNLSAKSLRDVLIGASPATAAAAVPQNNHASSQYSGANNRALIKAKGGGGNPQPSNGSSKVKPGMSYKSVIEPHAPVPLSQPHPSKPKPNAWAKPPSEIKAKLDVDMKNKVEEEHAAVKPLSDKPNQISGLAAPAGITPSSEGDKNKETNIPGTTDNGEEQRRTSASVTDDEGAPPPLSTLIGPGNSCSASSSVASSLEAPHNSSNRFRHQSSSATTEDDVGYHLLNVCGRLSEEITTFMSRRALALDIRRKERNAVLSALGDTLGKIWPGQCRVEMYGSCATQLDLPSSDLDLVVCGLDDVVLDHIIPAPPLHNTPSNSFHEQEETPQECIPMSQGNNHGRVSPRSPTVDRQHVVLAAESSVAGGSTHEIRGGEQTSLDLAFRSVEGGEQTSTVLDGSAENGVIMGMEYSPGCVTAENYSREYEPNQQAEVSSTDVAYSPAYSYHSQVSMGYDGEETSGMEGYTHEYQSNGPEFFYASSYSYVSSLSMNAQRVLRLASELELQPWAVQVKAIPTATVPVVKMLADPSKLPGLAGTWGNLMMHQHIAVQSGITVAGTPPPPISPEQGSGLSPQSHFFSPHQMTPQWRGADIMNGLQPVDITFEGPEHGGIGSTTYSTRVVQEACEELGLAPESTPVVQVASVLKELLAQRRLNEPFSGGLSSYGLLLLLLAVLKDRKIIQEEMQKFGKANAPATASLMTAQVVSAGQSEASPGTNLSDKSCSAPSTASKPTVPSSWASIAKKSNNGSTARTESSTVTKSTSGSAPATALTAKTTRGANPSDVEGRDAKNKVGNGKCDKSLTNKPNIPKIDNSNAPRSLEALAEKKQSLSGLDGKSAVTSQVTPSSETPSSEDNVSKELRSSSVPQGSNDILEVLCSGELTSGKLLMHFLLFYGHHFDARSTLIDINGTHHPEYGTIDFDRLSPFVHRQPGGTIDPITGMFSVDPIVVYDPLEGAVDHNVTKRCYCWNNVKWVFAQCYMTVSTIVETSDTTCGKISPSESKTYKRDAANGKSSGSGKPKEEQDPILEHFLSF